MKRTTLLLALISISIQITQAQVKRQYRDQDNAKTLVVVKEEGASNIDILNSQFDLADVSMGEEIMIIMRDGKPVMVRADGTPINDEPVPSEPAEDIFAGAEMPITETTETIIEEVEVSPEIQEVAEATPVVQKVAEPTTKAKASVVSNNNTSNRAKASTGRTASYKKKTKRSKRKKISKKYLKKRKKFKSRRGGSSCYKF